MSRAKLARHLLFADVSQEALEALEAQSEEIDLSGGEYLVRQGDRADALYFAESGRFRVVINGDLTVAHIEAGEAIGELAFFAGGERTADVVATRDSSVLKVSREAFDTIALQHPDLNAAMLKLVSQRLAAVTARASAVTPKIPKVIALCAAGDSRLPGDLLGRITQGFEQAVLGRVPVTALDRATSEAGNAAEYQGWLAEEEAKGGFILVDASGNETWGEMVCRNADALVMVADMESGHAALNALEQAALNWIAPEHRTVLLLRGKASTSIRMSGDWIDPRAAKLHHHVALDSEADFAKVGRFLTGHAVGLVLAGGGALGCAHLGIVRGLQQAGIPIDFIGGASAGAAMGGAIARGLTVAETLDQMEAMFIDAKAMKRLTLPKYSLLDPTVFDSELQERYGRKDIADQPVNFFGVSTNLSTNALHVHRRGALWECVRASGSLPTILPPFIDSDGNILVDGGVLDNVPVAVMHRLKAGPNIVVSLGDPEEVWRTNATYNMVRGRWQLLRDMMLRRKQEVDLPSIVEIMSRSMVVASRMASKEMLGPSDVMLTPPIIPGMELLDWHLGRNLAEIAAGYVAEQAETNPDLARLITK